MDSTRRAFLSGLVPILASIPFVGKLFAAPKPWEPVYGDLSPLVHHIETGSGSDGKNCRVIEWIPIYKCTPEPMPPRGIQSQSRLLLLWGGPAEERGVCVGRLHISGHGNIHWTEGPEDCGRGICVTHWSEIPSGPQLR